MHEPPRNRSNRTYQGGPLPSETDGDPEGTLATINRLVNRPLHVLPPSNQRRRQTPIVWGLVGTTAVFIAAVAVYTAKPHYSESKSLQVLAKASQIPPHTGSQAMMAASPAPPSVVVNKGAGKSRGKTIKDDANLVSHVSAPQPSSLTSSVIPAVPRVPSEVAEGKSPASVATPREQMKNSTRVEPVTPTATGAVISTVEDKTESERFGPTAHHSSGPSVEKATKVPSGSSKAQGHSENQAYSETRAKTRDKPTIAITRAKSKNEHLRSRNSGTSSLEQDRSHHVTQDNVGMQEIVATGKASLSRGELIKACYSFLDARKRFPDCQPAHLYLGICQYRMGRREEAERNLLAAIQINSQTSLADEARQWLTEVQKYTRHMKIGEEGTPLRTSARTPVRTAMKTPNKERRLVVTTPYEYPR